jgi:hypothetical protein
MKRKKTYGKEEQFVRAAEDTRIPAGHTTFARVKGSFDKDTEYLLEKNLIAGNDETFLTIPNALFSGNNPFVPISNTSTHPKIIRKGEVLGARVVAKDFFDKPKDLKQLQDFHQIASRVATMAEIQHELHHKGPPPSPPTQASTSDPPAPPAPQSGREENNESDDNWGPKTAEMPDVTVYPSDQLRDILDIGSLPEHLQQEAWEMLEK